MKNRKERLCQQADHFFETYCTQSLEWARWCKLSSWEPLRLSPLYAILFHPKFYPIHFCYFSHWLPVFVLLSLHFLNFWIKWVFALWQYSYPLSGPGLQLCCIPGYIMAFKAASCCSSEKIQDKISEQLRYVGFNIVD